MAWIIKPFRSNTAGAVPTTANLADGEMAINSADKKVYLRVGSSIVEVANANAPKGYIDGLKMEWVSANSLRVTSGSAYISSLGTILELPASSTKSGLSLTANTWYHVYLFLNGSTPDIEIVTTAPASPFYGTARAKTSDTSRRYIGSVRTGAANTMYKFNQDGTTVTYLENTNAAPFLVNNGGQAVVTTSISCAAVAPITSKNVKLTVVNSSSSSYQRISNSDGPEAVSGYITLAGPGGVTVTDVPVNSSQAFTYAFDVDPPLGNAYQRVFGYTYER